MIFPKGKVRHQDLMTSYTDLPALLSTLKSEGFSGTIEIEFPENKGSYSSIRERSSMQRPR
jgi:hypothetical protein